MTKLTSWVPPALARPLSVFGGVLFLIAALLPWATFLLNDGAYPEKATLQFFDAPFELTGFRWHLLLFGVAAVVITFVSVPGKGRVLRALGWGGLAIGLAGGLFIAGNGGGFGAIAINLADGTTAFGSIVAVIGGVVLVFGAAATGTTDIPRWPTRMLGLAGWSQRLAAWGVLIVAFAAVLWLVASTLTAGGTGGAVNPYAGPIFLAFLGFAGGLLGALHGTGVTGWVSRLSEEHRAFSILVLLGCAFGLPFTEAGSQHWMQVATTIGVYAATAIGLNIVVGLAGLLDIGYVAFLGIGAFVAANLSGASASLLDLDVPFPLAALCAAVVAGIFGAIVGSPTLRVRGDYLAIVTLAFGEIFYRSAQNNIGGMTGGSNSIRDIPAISMFGTAFNEPVTLFGQELASGVLYYFLIVLVIAAIMLVFANLKNSRIGRAWIAVREDEDAARAMGIRTGKVKILAFMVGATLAGFAGAIFVHKLAVANYQSFFFLESVTLLAAVILGGMGTIPGAVLGASLLIMLPEKLREFDNYRLLVFGLALVLIMRFRPQGLVPDRVRRAEFAGETAEGKSIEEVQEQAVLEQEQAEREHQAPAAPKEGS